MHPPPLDYMPVRYARRRPLWVTSGIPLTAIAVLMATALFWFSARMPVPLKAFIVFGVVLFGCFAVMSFSVPGAAWEHRQGAGVLEFRRPFDRGWATVQLDMVREVVQLRGLEGDWWYELVFGNGRRLLLDRHDLGPFEAFERELSTVCPEIQFGSREAGRCAQCGRFLYGGQMWRAIDVAFNTKRCEHCGGQIPARLPRIPQGGLVLPDGLNSGGGRTE